MKDSTKGYYTIQTKNLLPSCTLPPNPFFFITACSHYTLQLTLLTSLNTSACVAPFLSLALPPAPSPTLPLSHHPLVCEHFGQSLTHCTRSTNFIWAISTDASFDSSVFSSKGVWSSEGGVNRAVSFGDATRSSLVVVTNLVY